MDIRPLLVSAVEELLTGLNQGKKLEDVARQVDAFSDLDVMEFKKLFAISGRDVSKPVHVLEATFDFAIAAKKEAEEGSMFDIPQVTRADTMRELSHQMEEKCGRKATGFTTLNENTSGTVRAQEDAPRRDSGGNPSQDDDRGSGDDQKDAQQKEISARAKTAGEGEINSFWEPWSKPEESSRDDTIELLEGEYGLEPDEIVHASNLGYVIVADDGILSAKFYGHPSKAVRDHLKRTGWRWSFIFKEWRHSNKKKAREEINSFLSRFAEKESDDEMMFSQSGTPKTSETESLEHVKNEIAGLVGKDTLQAFEESGRVKFVSGLEELPKDIQKAVQASSSESTSDEKGSPEATRERWPQKEGLTTPYPSSGNGDRLSLKDLEIKYSKDGRVQGIYDPRTGQSFIITGNLDKDSAPGVFLHEVGVHMAADKEFRAVMKPIIKRGQQIVNVGFRNGDPIAAEAHKRLIAVGEKESNAEEATAYLVEAAISAKKVSNPIARWLRQVKAAINAWLIRHGFRDVNKLKTQDIADIALSNVRAMAANPASGTNPTYDRPNLELAFSITDSAGPGNSHSANTSWGFGPMITKDEFGKYQFGWGQKLYDGGARVLKRTFNLVDQLANNQFQLGMMGKELRKQMRQFKADQENIMYELEPIIKEMSSWDIPEREMVSDIIEKSLKTGVIPTDRAVRVAAAIQDIFNRQTDELLALGGISKESAERWRGQYLPRIYDRSAKEFQKNVFDAFFGRNKPIHSITGSHLKGRGIFETATNLGEIKQYAAMGWEVRDPNWKYENGKLEYVGNDPRAVSLFGSNSDQLISEGVTVWRDFSQEERLLMGEVRDALSRFILGYMATQRDLAVMRLYQSLAEDTRFSRGSPAEGYVYVPDVTIEGAGGVKKYGKLSGRYVTQEVFSQLHNVAKSSGWLNQAYKKMLSAWKEGKTVLSPVAHFNNTVGNLTMAHFAGVSYWDLDRYIDTANEFIKGDTPIIKEATKYGLFSGSFAKEEMAKLVPDPTIRELLKSSEGGLDKGINLVNGVLSWGLRSKLRSAYEFEDSFFKLMLYKKAREEAFMSPEDAVDWATSYIFTYDDLPSGAAMIRDYGAPFFAWTYKAIPCLLHTALTHPERFLCPAAVLYGLDMASYFLMAGGGDDDDLLQRWERARKLQEYERELLPDYMKGLTAFGTPKSIRIFNDSLTGQAQFLDISRWVPGGDMLDAENQMGGIELFQPLMPSHPLIGVFLAMIANKDSFTGKEVVNKAADTNVEITVKRMEWLAKSLSPALAPWGYHGTRLAQAISYETGHGHLKDLPGAKEVHEGLTRLLGKNGFTGNHVPMEFTRALQHTVGIKNRLVDFEYQEQMAGVKAKAEISAIKKQYQAKVRMANKQKLPMENLQGDFQDAAERIRRILQKERERRSKLAESKKGLRK